MSLPLTRSFTIGRERRGSSSSVIINQSSPPSPSPSLNTPRSSIVPMDFEETPTPTTPIAEEPTSPALSSLSVFEENQIFTTPTSRSNPKTRMKLKTIGKIVMPNIFRDNNNNTANTATSNEPVKKINKIKSPFIENCQRSTFSPLNSNKCMKYDHKSMPMSTNNGKDDENSDNLNDSGKENYDNVPSGVELRKKKFSTSSSSGVSSAPTSQRNSYRHSMRSPLVDEKYAKYFGISSNNSSDSRHSTPSTPHHKSFDNSSNMPDVVCVTPKPHLRQQNFSYSIEDVGYVQKSCSAKEVRIIPPSPNTPSTLSPFNVSDFSDVFDDCDFDMSNNSHVTPTTTSTTTTPLMIRRRERDTVSKRIRAMTVFANTPQSTPERKVAPMLRAARNRSMTVAHNIKLFLPQEPVNPISKFEDLKVTKEDLLMAHKEFERIFLGVV